MDRSSYNRGGGRTGGDGGGRGYSGGAGRGRGRGRNSQNQLSGNYQQQQGRGGDWRNNQNQNRSQAGYNDPPPAPVQQWGPRPVQDQGVAHPPQGGRGRPTTGRTWGPTPRPGGDATETQIQTSQLVTDFQSLEVSEKQPPCPSAPQGSMENKKMPIKRPDRGGLVAVRPVRLLVNHFRVKYNPANTIMHYTVEIKQESASESRFVKKIPKSMLHLIREKLCADNPSQFPLLGTAYDGENSIFSAIPLPTGSFKVQLSGNEDANGRSYVLSIRFVNEVHLSKLRDYLSGNPVDIPRDVLQGMDMVMKENSSKHMISVGRSMYSRVYKRENDLGCGIAAFRGFQQSSKLTKQGVVVCLDYSVIAFRKQMPVIEFLKEHIRDFQGVGDITRLRKEVVRALEGLKVTVTHRRTKQKYTIGGLTVENTQDIYFDQDDPEGKEKPKRIMLLDYFREKYPNEEIKYKDIPCLSLGKGKKPNYVPMEFCILADDKRFPKENLDKNAAILLRNLSLIPPKARRSEICEMVREEYGPQGGVVTRNFELEVDNNMTRVLGRVIPPPNLKLGTLSGRPNTTVVDKDKCHWNLVGKSVVQGKQATRWALIDFSSRERYNRLNLNYFIPKLIYRCRNLGVHMEEPLVVHCTAMNELSNVYRLRKLFENVMEEANGESNGGRLQIIICAMSRKDDGYKNIKWVSETQVGVITQCFLTENANKGDKFLDQYLANLALKINAKLGGSNVELIERLPLLEKSEDHVMFIGADVNHPASFNKTSPSIAAVVATMNWPAANRYAARVAPQKHRKEEITNFGSICLDLVNTYARLNNVRPNKIVIFRDGVSDAQFDMVLNKELVDLKIGLSEQNYYPTITVVVAQKRHQTRLFLENESDGFRPGNIPPGTVVDTTIVHPFEFDFFLCSHFGGLGTSKATHYTVIWDEHNYTSDQMQKLIYSLCFTFARCTKPVSLVPPVYYADLVAYRGRMFQEAAEQQSPASASSSSSMGSSGSSMSAASADIYKLHAELENFMFFV